MNTVYGRNFYTKRNSNESNPEGNEGIEEFLIVYLNLECKITPMM